MNTIKHIVCPACKNQTNIKIAATAKLFDYPLSCANCQKSFSICLSNLKISSLKELES